MEYKVIHETSTGALTKAVKASISEGWKPCGGVSAFILGEGDGIHCTQAMIKEEADEVEIAEGPPLPSFLASG